MNKKNIRIILFYLLVIISFFLNPECQASDKISEIKDRGYIIVGTTGDYKPMSFYNSKTQTYEGFDIELAKNLASSLGVIPKFMHTTWPTLIDDTLAKKFDIAISGISITKKRKKLALMSDSYLSNGKTILCRVEDINKYTNLESINQPNVRILENPGGLNEEFARKNFPKATILIHSVNEEIPGLIAIGKADVMITDIPEALFYSSTDKRLAAPLTNKPFTNGQIGILIPKDNRDLLKYVNKFLLNERKNGQLKDLTKRYIQNNKF